VPTCPGAELLLGFESPQLPEIVQGMLEPSQNWIAEQLLRALGTEHGEDGRASQGRAAAERFFVDEVGIDSTAIDLRDGSGLSAYDLVTPGAIIDLLQYAQTQPWGSQFRSALAAPGEEDSTLENRLASMEGRLEGKTGTITHVNSLSGYLRRDDGREIVFSILTNSSGLPSASVRRAMDEVVRVLARSR
jgi:D-alanyl-D-alanine carboxypeptidase/D-alanyl-D-alanine-endopeptidase (penicillin-binding protein 4)